MYYEPDVTTHGLPYNPFKSCVVPRPIGWISTIDPEGRANLAPYSQFQNISYDPPIVMFAANYNRQGARKHTPVNAEREGAFVWNMATFDLCEAVNITSANFAAGVDEFEMAGLAKAPSRRVRVPRVADSPISFECEYLQTLHFGGNLPMGPVDVVFGKVVGIHIADHALTPDGRIDVARLRPLARLGYYDYAVIDRVFTMMPPADLAGAGLEGAPEKNAAS